MGHSTIILLFTLKGKKRKKKKVEISSTLVKYHNTKSYFIDIESCSRSKGKRRKQNV